ncbi:hypothetical protein BC829DRAFT_389466 [Chytridium lagenaria]|nr:hypothetical protein BC829DRAFT_389466 [Chytridium lagenaria]
MEDIFESSLGVMFDEPTFAAIPPSPSNSSSLPSPQPSYTHAIRLDLPDVEAANSPLMAHYVWQASLILSQRIANGDISIRDAHVIEVGAGAGLLGVTSGLCGAKSVVLTDYPDSNILRCLEVNAARALGVEKRKGSDGAAISDVWWEVVGHKWGDLESRNRFLTPIRESEKVVIFLADVLWNPLGHQVLLDDLKQLLDHPNATAYVAAGLHTGRRTMESFFKKAVQSGDFLCVKVGEVRVGSLFGEYELFPTVLQDELENGVGEESDDDGEDATEKKRWVVLYDIKRRL